MHYPLFAYIIKFNQTRSVKYVNIHYYVMFLKLVLNFNNYYKSHHIYLKWKKLQFKIQVHIFFNARAGNFILLQSPSPKKTQTKRRYTTEHLSLWWNHYFLISQIKGIHIHVYVRPKITKTKPTSKHNKDKVLCLV